MMTPAQIALEQAQELAAVASTLRLVALQNGGEFVATAERLHQLGKGPAWPSTAAFMAHHVLPALARKPGHAGCTVRAIGGGPSPRWHVQGQPLPQPAAAARPVAAPVRRVAAAPKVVATPAAPAPSAPLPRPYGFMGGGHLPVPSVAEFQRVKEAAAAAGKRRMEARKAAFAAEKRAIEHAENLRLINLSRS